MLINEPGKPGPKPKPRGRRAKPAGSLRCPAYLVDIPAAAKAWRTLAPLIDDLWGYSKLDELALASLCLAFSTMVECAESIAKDGALVVDSRGGVKRNPALLAWRDASSQVRSWASEFGLSPAARSVIPADKPDDSGDLAAVVAELMGNGHKGD